MHIREQDSARNRRTHPDNSRRGAGSNSAPDQGPRVSHVGIIYLNLLNFKFLLNYKLFKLSISFIVALMKMLVGVLQKNYSFCKIYLKKFSSFSLCP